MEAVVLSKNTLMPRRIAAFFVDQFIITLIVLAPAFIFFMPTNGTNDFFSIFPFVMTASTAGFLLKDVFGGRSIGKRLFGLFVRDNDDITHVPSFFRLIQRNLLIMIWPIEFIVSSKDPSGRRLGDKFAKTLVIGYPTSNKRKYILIGVAAFLLFYFSVFLIITQAIRNDEAYDTAVHYIQTQDQIKSKTGKIDSFGNFPSGSLKYTNGYGSADLRIKVNGEMSTLMVEVLMTKEPDGEWIVRGLKYRPSK